MAVRFGTERAAARSMAVQYSMDLVENTTEINGLQGEPQKLPWFAVRVRSRFEHTVAENLQALGYERYLPAYKSERRWSDRIKVIQRPLFPGYVFCRLDFAERTAPVVQIPGVVDILKLGNRAVSIPESEIAAVRKMQYSGLAIGQWPFLAVGEWVLIENGPLCGLEGLLTDIKGVCRLVVSVPLMQRSVSAEIDRKWVRPIKRSGSGQSPIVLSV